MASALPELSDGLLLEECRRGNMKAYDVLFDRYSDKLYHYALKYVKEEVIAEEMMMDLMLWVWEKRQQLDPDVHFSAYLFRAMKNAIIKKLTRKSAITIPLDHIADNYASNTYNADNRINSNELTEIYNEQLAELSQQRKKVFKLSRHEELSHAEIAAEMNLSVFTVKNHIKASLTHFRRYLKDYVDITTMLLICLLMA